MALDSLEGLYVDELKDLYNAENQILKALPKMIKTASSSDLQTAFEDHLEKTEGHVQRLEQIFGELGRSPKGKKCVGMEGVIQEGKELMEEDADPDVMDAGLIAAAQHVEHYEMAGYGTARTWAQQLGYREAAQLLEQTLEEEKEADAKLSQLAESHINVEAEEGNGQGTMTTSRISR
jgi:ferritin-like metal-binding protein YciE